jgi:hypothetical protein
MGDVAQIQGTLFGGLSPEFGNFELGYYVVHIVLAGGCESDSKVNPPSASW